MHCIFFIQSSHVDLVFFFVPLFPSFSFFLSLSYSHCFCWLSLSLCGCFVAQLESAVSASSSVQAPAPAAQRPQGPLQVLKLSSPSLALLAGICTCVACRSVRAGIRTTNLFPISLFCSVSSICISICKKLTGYKI